MLLQAWKNGTEATRVVSVAVGTGLLAHFIFGFTDAITLWDRFSFVFWMMLGIAGATYTKSGYSDHTSPQNETAVFIQ